MSTTPDRSPTENSTHAHSSQRSPVQLAALAFGIVFLLVGIAGFIPGITTGYDTMQFAGHHSEAMLMGIFQVSILHNIVHLPFGIAGLLLARTGAAARQYLLWGGIIYFVLWLYDLFIGHESPANFVPLNDADNWLHLGLALAMVALSFLPRGTQHTVGAPSRPSGLSS